MPGRMGTIAASWPFGNALSLVLLGMLISAGLPGAAALMPAALALAAALLIGWALVTPRKAHDNKTSTHLPKPSPPLPQTMQGHLATPRPTGTSLSEWKQALSSGFLPGMVFALYNVSFILFISFTPQLLSTQGYTSLAASNIASLPMWLFVFSVPVGGVLAGRSAANGKWLVALGCLGGGVCIACSQIFQDKAVWYVLAGILGGLPTGAMLAMVGRATHGLFYSTLFFIFFITLLIFPPIVGAVIEYTGDIRTSIVFCVTMLIAAFLFFIRPVNQGDIPHV
jgi:Major Facilitator Superfamily